MLVLWRCFLGLNLLEYSVLFVFWGKCLMHFGWGLSWMCLLLLLLLKHGGDVYAADNMRQTALHWAAVRGSIGTADVLLQNGARVEAADVNGYRVNFFVLYYCCEVGPFPFPL